jgi:hypothetical protein
MKWEAKGFYLSWRKATPHLFFLAPETEKVVTENAFLKIL